MLERGRISGLQLFLLQITLVAATAIILVQSIVARYAGPGGWVTLLLLPTAVGLAVAWVCTRLGNRFPRETVIEYAPRIVGWPLGKLVGLAIVLTFMILGVGITREFGELLVTFFYPRTPIEVFSIILVVVSALAVRGGLEVIARGNEFIFPLGLLSFFLLFILLLPEVQLGFLRPVLENGWGGIIKAGYTPSAFRSEVGLVLLLLPYLNQPRHAFPATAAAVLVLAVFLASSDLIVTGVFSAEFTRQLVFPLLSASRYATLGNFLQRMEAFTMLIWVTGVTVKLALFYYASCLGAAQLLGFRHSYRPLVWPIGIILVAWSIAGFENIIALRQFVALSFPPTVFIAFLVLPALLLAVAAARGLGQSRGNLAEGGEQ